MEVATWWYESLRVDTLKLRNFYIEKENEICGVLVKSVDKKHVLILVCYRSPVGIFN